MSLPDTQRSGSANRREARRLAVCALYAREFTDYTTAQTLPMLIAMKPDGGAWPEFTRHLCYAVEQHIDDITRDLESVLENWKLDRVAPVERAILKLGAAEITYFPDIPPRVTINEYIELAKSYANDNAPAFINGVLDRLSHLKGKKDFQAAARQAAGPRVYSASGRNPSGMGTSAVQPPPPASSPAPRPSQQAPEPVRPQPSPEPVPSRPVTPSLQSGSPTASAAGGLALEKIQSRWAREIYEALSELGGTAQTEDLYSRIEQRGRMPLTPEWQMTVQGTLDRHNADSFNFEGDPGNPLENLFVRLDRRQWGIRRR